MAGPNTPRESGFIDRTGPSGLWSFAMLGTPETIENVHPLYKAHRERWELVHDLAEAKNIQRFIQNQVDPMLTGAAGAEKFDSNRSGSDGRNYSTHDYRVNEGAIDLINQRFKDRAVYTNVTGETIRTLVGMAFSVPCEVELDAGLAVVEENADGDGTTLPQFAQDSLRENLRVGRGGILVEYPKHEKPLSMADMDTAFPTLILFSALQIRDWETMRVGAHTLTSRLVLSQMERYTSPDGKIDKMKMVLLEFWLAKPKGGAKNAPFAAHHRKWNKVESTGESKTEEWVAGPTIVYQDAAGKPKQTLPWAWFGSEANTHRVDFAPMRDIAEVNAKHYNASAIYEDSVHVCGQVQPWVSGMDAIESMNLRRSGFQLGSGIMLSVGKGERFEFAQAEPNMLSKESMDSKMEQMLQLGARLLTPGGAAKTAEESRGEERKQHSVLSWCANNVSAAVTRALEIAAEYVSATGTNELTICTDFMLGEPNPQVLAELWKGVIAGKITDRDLHAYLAGVGLAGSDFEEWLSEQPEPPEPAMPPGPGGGGPPQNSAGDDDE